MSLGLCERCKKAQATFHLTNIDKYGAKAERHLCDRCATEEGLLQQSPKISVDLGDILQGFVSQAKGGGSYSNLVCENCGISYVEFRNQGLLGCANDYEVFREPLVKLIDRAHAGATHHVGKSPGVAKPANHTVDLRKLKKHLEEAVAAEDYERAAELRDRIRRLEEA